MDKKKAIYTRPALRVIPIDSESLLAAWSVDKGSEGGGGFEEGNPEGELDAKEQHNYDPWGKIGGAWDE